MNLAWLIFIGGILHFGILIASGLVPQVLDWKNALKKIDPLFQQLVWVHGAFIVLIIIAFGLLSVLLPDQLAEGSPLARAMCLMIAVFWGARLLVQLTFFDAKSYLTTVWLKLGYHSLTLVFAYHALVYAWAAIC